MNRLGLPELIILLCVVLLFFGAKRLPQLAGSLGTAIRNFKKGFATDDETPKLPPE